MEQANKLQSLEEARERAAYAGKKPRRRARLPQDALGSARPVDHAEDELEKLKRQAGAKRNAYTEAKAALDGIERDIRGRQFRLKSINEERAALAAAHQERERPDGEPRRAPWRHQKRACLRLASCPAKIAERRATRS